MISKMFFWRKKISAEVKDQLFFKYGKDEQSVLAASTSEPGVNRQPHPRIAQLTEWSEKQYGFYYLPVCSHTL